MMFWVENNKQFIFSDPSKNEYLIRIIGQENFSYFKQAGLDEMELPPEAAKTIADIIDQNPDISDSELSQLIEAGKVPKYPVVINPKEKNPSKIELKPKMKINETGDVAELSITPEDMSGVFDYIPDIKSMRSSANDELIQGRQVMISTLITGNASQNVLQLLAQEGYRPKVKELLENSFEDLGMKDASRFFEKLPNVNQEQQGQPTVQPTNQPGQPNQIAQAGTPEMGSIQPNIQNGGLPQIPQAPPGASPSQQMA
jgi:hypothetical protein